MFVYRFSGRFDFFLRHARLQCSGNRAGKLVEFATAFAGAVDIGVVIDDLGFVGSKSGEYFFSFDHANFAL